MGGRELNEPVILALDIGTSSCRAGLFDPSAARVEGTLVQRSYQLDTTPDGGAELDPALLLGGVQECFAGALERGGAQEIAAVGATGFWHSLLGVDADGQPLTPIYTWADARCREDAAKLREELSEKEVHRETGCMLRASFWPAKLRWLRRTQPSVFRKVHTWMSPAEWVQLQLCGEATCAYGMATGTGLFDPTQLDWSDRMLDAAGIRREQLLPLSDKPVPAPDRRGLERAQWFPAIGDGAASNLGSGATRPGFAAINVGTSAAVRVMREGTEARAPLGLFAYRVDAARYLIGGAVSNAGNLREWCLRELRLPGEVEIEAALAARPGPACGLTVLPFWNAERAPQWDEEARGSIHGITQATTALDLLQAVTEGVYQRIAWIAEMVEKAGGGEPKFIVSGGIQNSAASMQRLADVMNRPLHPNDDPEATIRGAAILALERLGAAPQALPLAQPIHPRERYAAEHLAARQRQREIEEG